MSELGQYISANPRNKLAFCLRKAEGFEFVDIGYELSLAIKDKIEYDNIVGIALDELKKTLDNGRHGHPEYGKYIAITNIGILLEPELKIDVGSLLEQYSKTSLLVVNTYGVQLPKINTGSVQI